MSEQEQTPRERVQEWLSGDHEGIAMYGATREVREAIRAVLAALGQAQGVYETSHASRVHADGCVLKLEAERDALREERDGLAATIRAWPKYRYDSGYEIGADSDQKTIAALVAEVERVKMLLGKAAQEIHCAGPVDHRIRVLRREHADLVLRLADRAERAEAALRLALEELHGGLPDDAEVTLEAALRDTAPREEE